MQSGLLQLFAFLGRAAACAAAALFLTAGVLVYAQSNYVTPPYRVNTYAGYSGAGAADGTGAAALFNNPNGIALDAAGNAYVADTSNSMIRRVTPQGVVTTLAGVAGADGLLNGPGASARFNQPFGLAVAPDGSVYVADTSNHLLRKISPSAEVSTFAGGAGMPGSLDGTGTAARFNYPTAIALHSPTGDLYVADTENHILRKVTAAGQVSTFAGTVSGSGSTVDGTGSAARFNSPIALVFNAAGTRLYVAEGEGQVIRAIELATRQVTTLAGLAGSAGTADGTGSAARFDRPKGLAFDTAGNLYVADSSACRIRRVTTSGVVTSVAGAAGLGGSVDGTGGSARFNLPTGLAYIPAGNQLLVADSFNSQLRVVSLDTALVSTLAGPPVSRGSVDGLGMAARFSSPRDLVLSSSGTLYVADRDNHLIRKITPDGLVSTLAGVAQQSGANDGTGSAARFNKPAGLALNADGSVLYVADADNHLIRRITTADGRVSTFAGLAGSVGSADGTGQAARFNQPSALALDSSGNLFVADYSNHTLRKITPLGVVTTFAGSAGMPTFANGTGSSARFWAPIGLAIDLENNLFVADSYNQVIRKITPAAVVSTFAGSPGLWGTKDDVGTAARFFYPYDVSIDGSGRLYVTDYANHLIRRILPDGTVRTLVGTSGSSGSLDGLGNASRFRNPEAITVDATGLFYVADTSNNTIRRAAIVDPPLITSSLSASGTVGIPLTPYSITGTLNPIAYAATGLPAGLSVNPSTGVISGISTVAGTFTVTISAENVSGVGSATLVLSIAKGSANIELSGLSVPYDGTPKAPLYATTPVAGLPVVFTYNGSSTTPTRAGVYSLLATINSPNYQGVAAAVFTITAPLFWSVTTPAIAAGQTISGLAFDSAGNLYLADPVQHVIRKRTPAGVESILAGGGGAGLAGYINATGTAARFSEPSSLVADNSGNLYVADTGNHCIRKITPSGGVSLVAGSGDPFDWSAADGIGTSARFYLPNGLVLTSPDTLLVADTGNASLRVITLSSLAVSTIQLPSETLVQPFGLALSPVASEVFVSDQDSNRIFRVTLSGTVGTVVLYAGGGLSPGFVDGQALDARFNSPRGMVGDADANLYVADAGNHVLRKITPAGSVLTIAGQAGNQGLVNGFGSVARLNTPLSLARDALGGLFVADFGNSAIRHVSPPPSLPVITSADSALGIVNQEFTNYNLTATGSSTSYTAAGLPAGLVLNSSTGQISGKPLLNGVYNSFFSVFTEIAVASKTVTFYIAPPPITSWKTAYFDPLAQADPSLSGPDADPDGDGVANLLEYLLGTHPLNRDATPPALSVADGYLTLIYERPRYSPGWVFKAEWSADLQTWHQTSEYLDEPVITILDAKREQASVRSRQALDQLNRQFLRLRVENAP